MLAKRSLLKARTEQDLEVMLADVPHDDNEEDAKEGESPALSTARDLDTPMGHRGTINSAEMNQQEAERTFWSNLKDVDHIAAVYDKLDANEVSKAACCLELIVVYETPEAADCKRTFKKVLMFKGRAMESATILHFAIWLASESDFAMDWVDKVLSALDDPADILIPGVLPTGEHNTLYPAIHMAAGLGLKRVLKRLSYYATHIKDMTVANFVNSWAYSQKKTTLEETKFCQPIHDSSYAGHADVTLWLVKHGADPLARNFNRITPLHFLALNGIRGDMEAIAKHKMKKIVQAMVTSAEHREPLESEADMSKFIKDAVKVTPLEIAVQDASNFPQDNVGLLAPCLYNPAKLSYFFDIKRIASVTPKGALNLVKAIAEKGQEDQDLLKHFRLNAQADDASDMIASIFYAAPEAASEMLDMLESEPLVQDSAHHPLPTHARLSGMFFDLPMVTSYQADARLVGKLEWPIWRWERSYDEITTPRTSNGQKLGANWQASFVTDEAYHSRKHGIKSVNVKVSLMPNVLDIDILMSLASLMDSHASVMKKKTVQGIIFALWQNLIRRLWFISSVFCFVDLLALLVLVFFLRRSVVQKQYLDNLEALALCGVFAGLTRSLLELCQVAHSVSRKAEEFEGDEVMAPMWSLLSDWFWTNYIRPSISLILMGAFLVVHINKTHNFVRLEKYIFCVCLLFGGLQFISLFRFQIVGSAIYTIRRTALSPAANQVVFIFGLIFVSFVFILLVLARGDDGLLVIAAVRGWLFADGDGFNEMDMKKGLSDLSVIGLVAAFFFNVVVLNMIIAVYGNEYDKARDELKFDFLRGRANYCTQGILSSYVIPYKGETEKQCLIGLSLTIMGLSAYAAFRYHSVFGAGLVLGAAERLLLMATIQCDWFSPEGGDSKGQRRHLWMCHDIDWPLWLDDCKHSGMESTAAIQDVDAAIGEGTHDVSKLSKSMDEQYSVLLDRMDSILDKLESQTDSRPLPRKRVETSA
jgi:hypothetical protein